MVIVAGALPVIIAVGIFLIQYLPTNELAGQPQRSEITYEKATEGSLQFKNGYTAIVPGIFGRVTGDKNTPATITIKRLTDRFRLISIGRRLFILELLLLYSACLDYLGHIRHA